MQLECSLSCTRTRRSSRSVWYSLLTANIARVALNLKMPNPRSFKQVFALTKLHKLQDTFWAEIAGELLEMYVACLVLALLC